MNQSIDNLLINMKFKNQNTYIDGSQEKLNNNNLFFSAVQPENRDERYLLAGRDF